MTKDIISRLGECSIQEIGEGILFIEGERIENKNAVTLCCLELLDLEDQFDTLQRKIQQKKFEIESFNLKENHHKSLLLVLKGVKQKNYENAD